MRISLKLALAFLSVVFAGVVAQMMLSVRWHAALYRADAIRDLRTMARTLGPAAAAVMRTHGEQRAATLVEETNDRIEATRIHWIAAGALDEAPLLQQRASRLARLHEGRELIVTGGDDGAELIHLYQPVALDESLRGVIEFSEPLVGGPEILAGRLATVAAVAALLVAACGSVAYLVSQRWVERPLGALIGKARRIGAEDFSAPVQLEGHLEFGELAREMNLMAAKLEAARTRVESETAARIRAIEQVRHADRLSTIGRLAAGMAHELGTPLNVVSERAEMIVQGEHADPDGVAQSALVIQQQAMRMAGSVRHLLDFARRPEPDRRSTCLGELASSAARLVTPLLERRGVAVRTLDAPAPVCCDVDLGQIQQVLINLLTNAVDVTPRGGEVRIRVERSQDGPPGATACGPFACLSVEDDGPGIEPEQRARIFEPFFTTKPAGQGTGLGLAVTEEIVREHGGVITVESEIGSGTRMRVWLPLESGA